MVNLIADFGQKALHTICCGIVLAQLPDDSDTVEDVGDESWDIGWLSPLDLSARVLQDFEEVSVALGFVETRLDLVLKEQKGLQV